MPFGCRVIELMKLDVDMQLVCDSDTQWRMGQYSCRDTKGEEGGHCLL